MASRAGSRRQPSLARDSCMKNFNFSNGDIEQCSLLRAADYLLPIESLVEIERPLVFLLLWLEAPLLINHVKDSAITLV